MNVLLDSQCVTDRTALMHHTLLVECLTPVSPGLPIFQILGQIPL